MPPGEEAVLILRAVASAPRPTNGLTGLQATLFRAIVQAMLGLDVDLHALEPVEADGVAGARAGRDRKLRPRLVQHMELLNLVLQPLDHAAARRVEVFAEEPCIGDECVHRLRALAEGSLQLAAHDFDRNRFLKRFDIDSRPAGVPSANCHPTRSVATSTTSTSCAGWRFRHAGLHATPAREHDWVHVLADYGTVEAEIEAFGFIARASDAPDVFALHLDELRRDLGAPPTSLGNDRGRQHPALASRRHEPRPAGPGSEREGSNRHHVPRAIEAGAMTAKPCDPTATAQEEGR